MNFNTRIASRACLFFAILGAARGLAQTPPTTVVRDIDNEARNAFHVHCTVNLPGFTSICNFPAVPQNKRFAVREITATCLSVGISIPGFGLDMNSTGNPDEYIIRAQSLSTSTGSQWAYAHEPLFASIDGGDLNVTFRVFNRVGNEPGPNARCTGILKGFLINMP